MQIVGIANILFVKDFDRMTAFYEEHLGLEAEPSAFDGWRRYPVGSGSFALHAIPSPYADSISIDDPPTVREGTPVKPIFFVADVAAAREELTSRGVRRANADAGLSDELDDFVDPEGNVFQIARP